MAMLNNQRVIDDSHLNAHVLVIFHCHGWSHFPSLETHPSEGWVVFKDQTVGPSKWIRSNPETLPQHYWLVVYLPL